MNNIMIFENEKFGEIRTISINNEPWFVGKDVAEILGYKDINRAVKQHIDKEDLKSCSRKDYGDLVPTLWNGENDFANKVMINESGLYCLVISSKLPSAKEFKRWVTSEVLPSIRQTGSYSIEQSIPRTYGEALLEAGRLAIENEKKQEIIDKQEEVIEELIDSNAYLETENDRLQSVCNIPKKQLVKDIKCFVSEYVKQVGTIGSKVHRDSMYEAYRFARRTRMEQPCKYTFEDILHNECKLYKDNQGNWMDVRVNEAKLKRY